MRIIQEEFGKVDNQLVEVFTLINDQGVEIACLNYGCIITKIITPDNKGNYENIVLGFDNLDGYRKYAPYFGAVIGRVAGRIKAGHFELNGKTYTLPKNENNNHLHGGFKGFNDVVWDAAVIEEGHEIGVRFSYTSPDGEEGYPGNIQVQVVYTLNNDNELCVRYYGKSDQTTLLNLTNHTYFNLSGNLKRNVLEHSLQMKSDRFLQLDEELLPTGDILDVTNTPFDFREGRVIREGIISNHPQIELAGQGYDHPFFLNANRDNEIVLQDLESGRTLTIETDEVGVVLYTGNQLTDDYEIYDVPSQKYLGLCLETQGMPDAIHHPHLPSCILEKDKEYRSVTKYKFTVKSSK